MKNLNNVILKDVKSNETLEQHHDDKVVLLKPKQVAEKYNISVRTLEKWRFLKKNLNYVKINKNVFYRIKDIEQFMNGHDIKVRDKGSN